jgi:NAD(P)H dehydrogenase (quinone)
MSATKPLVLVCGAGGNTGHAVAESLLKDGNVRVRAGVRSLDKAKDLEQKGAEVVHMDFADKNSVRNALRNVDRMWITAPNPPKDGSKPFERIRLTTPVFDAAKEAGVRFVLFGSVAGTNPHATGQQAGVLFQQEFAEAERHLLSSGLDHCILRMGVFIENIVLFQEALRNCQFPQPLGTGAYCPLAVSDVGTMAASILTHPARHSRAAYTITGRDSMTGEGMAACAARVLHRPIKYVDAPKDAAMQLLAKAVPEWQARGFLELYDLFRQNLAKDPSPDYEKVMGKRGTGYEDRLRQLRDAGIVA